MPYHACVLLLASTLMLSACGSTDDGGTDLPPVRVTVERAFESLRFNRPVDMQVAGDGSNRLYVVEQAGRVLSFADDPAVSAADLFLDIRPRVSRSDNEEGLLGLAFHPRYSQNGYVYVYYSASSPRRSVLARLTASGGVVDPESETVLMEVAQPYGNHNAGQLQFGPDGYLYVSLGDGGAAGDPLDNAQNPTTLLGSLLRIDVDAASAGLPYGIPPDNPFAGDGEGRREEIYAYGLRNPWRFSFDRETGWLWLADVGQSRFEEVNIVERGKNYGWDELEASRCFEPMEGCNESGLTRPIWSYNHSEGRSITGGYVYRGTRLPGLVGRYIYGDYVSGRIWALHYDGGAPVNHLLAHTNLPISSFGQDSSGEVYILALTGEIYRLDPQDG